MTKSGVRRPIRTFADMALPDELAGQDNTGGTDEEYVQRLGRLHARLLVDEMITALLTGAELPFDLDKAVAAVERADTAQAASYTAALCEFLGRQSSEFRSATELVRSGHDRLELEPEDESDWLADFMSSTDGISQEEALSLADRILGVSRAIAGRAEVTLPRWPAGEDRSLPGVQPQWTHARPADGAQVSTVGGLGRAETPGARHATTSTHRPGTTRSAS